MDDNAKGELLKRLMAHDVMGGGRQFLSTALLLYLDPEELKNCRQVSSSSRMSVTVCVCQLIFMFNTINALVGQQGVEQVDQGDVEEPGHEEEAGDEVGEQVEDREPHRGGAGPDEGDCFKHVLQRPARLLCGIVGHCGGLPVGWAVGERFDPN